MSIFSWKSKTKGEGEAAPLPAQRTDGETQRSVQVIQVPMDVLVELYNSMVADAGLKELTAQELAARTQDPGSDPTILFAAGEISGRNEVLQIFGGFILEQGGVVNPATSDNQQAA